MECKSCGHKHKTLNDDWEVEHKDTEGFIELKGNFTVRHDGYYTESLREVYLYACPECYTVQMGM